MTNFLYCERWSRDRKLAVELLTDAQARTAHEEGKLYTVLIDSFEAPSAFIEVVGENDYVGVSFLDDVLRDYMLYAFQRVEDGRLFLTRTTRWLYSDSSERIVFTEHFLFRRSGEVTVQQADLATGTKREGSRKVDVSTNYEAWPEFGRYEHLIQIERGAIQ